jgi:hypothetical protein
MHIGLINQKKIPKYHLVLRPYLSLKPNIDTSQEIRITHIRYAIEIGIRTIENSLKPIKNPLTYIKWRYT